MNFAKVEQAPRFPEFLTIPFKLAPKKLHSKLLILFLNRILSQQLIVGELNFLEKKNLRIVVSDANIIYNISISNGKFTSTHTNENSHLVIKASIYDFLSLAARKEDPDSLVFQRRLTIEGDTELGLELKNFLEGIDIESTGAFSLIESLLQRSLPIYRQLFS